MAGFNDDVYKLASTDEVLGNDVALTALKNFAVSVNKGEMRKPLLVHGPSGTGKSALISMLAKENGWDILELNASDNRDEESIKRLIAASAIPKTIMGNRKIIVFDEIDELASRFDKGASSGINTLIAKSRTPIVFIANNMWDKRITFLRGKVEEVKFKKLEHATIKRVLERVARSAKLNVSQEIIDTIATRSKGDARSAINDICVLDGAVPESVEILGWRDRKTEIFEVLDKIFMSNTVTAPLIAIASSDVSIDMMINWVEENIPKRYTEKGDMKRAFDSLSTASTFFNRASRSQYYTYWRYANFFMASGVAMAKTNYPSTLSRYEFPKKIKEMSLSKQDRGSAKTIAQKMSSRIHTGAKKIAANEIPTMVRQIARALSDGEKEDEIIQFLQSAYDLDKSESEYLIERAQSPVKH
jgi:replication factor C large subunit